MHFLLTIATIVFCSCVSVYAQDKPVKPGSRHIVILNKKYEPIKEINIGDFVRLKLKNEMKVKGHVISIDSMSFTVDYVVIYLEAINKISTKKTWQPFLGVPFAAFGVLATMVGFAYENEIVLYGLGMTGIGFGLILPGYYKIGTSNWFVMISNKPDTVNN